MKKLLNHIIKPMLLLVLIAFTGCEKDLYEDGLQNGSRTITIKHISINDLDKTISSQINEKIALVKKMNENESTVENRFEYDSSLGIYIDTENGKLIDNNGELSYTFPMFRDSEEHLENIIFKPISTGEIETYISKYNVKPEEFVDLTYQEISNLEPELQKMSANGWYIVCIESQTQTGVTPIDNGDLTGNFGYEPVWETTGTTCYFIDNSGSSPMDFPIITSNGTTGSNGGGSSSAGVSTSPTGISPEQLQMKNFVKNLTDEQEDWYVENPDAHQTIQEYLVENNFSDESEEFIKDCIDEINEDPNDELTSITPFLIVKKIDDSELNPCSKSVFQQIKNMTNDNFVSVLSKLNAEEKTYNTTMISAVAPSGAIGQTIRNSAYNYTIYISTDYTGKTKLMIAQTLLHELVHAYFFSLIDDCYLQNSCELLSTYPDLWEYFVNHSSSAYPSNSISHHEEIANSYVSAIASALQEYQLGLPTQVYEDLAWSGLEGTNIFNTLHPEGSDSRQRILNRKAAEQTGHVIGQGTTNEQIQLGQPCN